jgi:YD repeat-containing protein
VSEAYGYNDSSLPVEGSVTYHADYYYPLYLSQIQTPNIQVAFNVSSADRLDVKNSKSLTSITVTDRNTSKSRAFSFSYDYFMSSTVGGNLLSQTFLGTSRMPPNWIDNDSETLSRRLKLLSFQEQGSKPYIFTYNSTPLPYKTSCAVDHWGYYNGVNNSTLIPNLTRVLSGLSASAPFPDLLRDVYHISADRGADANFMKACVLEKIKYPTGGVTTLEYEPNTFTNYSIPPAGYNEFIEQYDVNATRKGSDTQVSTPVMFTPLQIPGSSSFTLDVKIEGFKGAVQDVNLTNPQNGEIITPQMRKDELFNTLKNATVSLVQYTLTGNYAGVIKSWKLPDAAFYVSYDNITSTSLIVIDQIQLPRNYQYGLSVGVAYSYGSFDYMGGEVKVNARLSNYVPKPFNGESIGGGLRIKEIKNYESDNSSQPATITQYTYAGGKLMLPLRYFSQKRYYLTGLPNEEPYATQIGNSNNMSTNTGGLGQMVGYDEVTEKAVDKTGTQNNGNTKYQYTNQPLFVAGSLPAVTQWTNGLEIDREIYDSQNNLKKKTSSQYKDLNAATSTHDKFYAGYTGYQMPEHEGGGSQSSNAAVFDLTYYYIFEFNNVPVTQVEKTFDGSSPVRSTAYQYNNNGQVISKIDYMGDVNSQTPPALVLISETKSYYPANPPTGYSSDHSGMLNRNFLLPLKTERFRNNKKVYERTVNYNLANISDTENPTMNRPVYLPFKITENPNAIIGKEIITDVAYTNGNVGQVIGRHGIPVSILWGYKATLPVARIENATFSNVQAVLTGCASQCPPGDSNCDAKFNCLRTNLPNARITNYQYNVMDGVTSITDVNGKKAVYEYDALSRLINIRDSDNNLITLFDYHLRD